VVFPNLATSTCDVFQSAIVVITPQSSGSQLVATNAGAAMTSVRTIKYSPSDIAFKLLQQGATRVGVHVKQDRFFAVGSVQTFALNRHHPHARGGAKAKKWRATTLLKRRCAAQGAMVPVENFRNAPRSSRAMVPVRATVSAPLRAWKRPRAYGATPCGCCFTPSLQKQNLRANLV
jgi:hypothetical protein